VMFIERALSTLAPKQNQGVGPVTDVRRRRIGLARRRP